MSHLKQNYKILNKQFLSFNASDVQRIELE